MGKATNAFTISIHAPHEGERLAGVGLTSTSDGFQSTLPTRGSDWSLCDFANTVNISIHAPHEGERLHIAQNVL